MISSLKGIITYKGNGFTIIEVGGIGYQVFFPDHVLSELTSDTELTVYCHDHIREDTRDLFGFLSIEGLDFFKKLLSVQGVGPKVAQKICASDSVEELRKKVMAGQIDFLTTVPGVGKKTAQKIVLELKGVLTLDEEQVNLDTEVVDALKGLGYTTAQAHDAAKAVPAEVESTEDRIRAALKYLSTS